jgi:hypothetical protein
VEQRANQISIDRWLERKKIPPRGNCLVEIDEAIPKALAVTHHDDLPQRAICYTAAA